MAFLETMAKLIERYNSFFTEGIVNTLIIAAFSVLFGAILGTLMASLRMCRIPPLRWIAVAYIEFVRGTPLMVQLMFIFYGLPMIGITIPNIPWIPNFSRFAAGIVAMSMNSCAYVAEIIRSGIQAVDGGQMEAARSVGFSSGEAMRLVVLPQAVRNILPALGNEFVTVIKESSIVSVIGIADLMFRTNDVIAVTYKKSGVSGHRGAVLLRADLYQRPGCISGGKEDVSWKISGKFSGLLTLKKNFISWRS